MNNIMENKSRMVRWGDRYFTPVLVAVSLLAYLFFYGLGRHGHQIRADGVGYYLYLPSMILYGDPTFERVAAEQFQGQLPHWTGTDRHPETGRYVDKFNVGVAAFILPFFLGGHAVALLAGYPTDGFSEPYQHAAALSGFAYFLAGVVLLRRLLRRRFSPGVALAAMAALIFGTDLFHYGVCENVTTHVYSFLLFVLLFLLVPRWYEKPALWTRAAAIGAVAGLIALVRIVDVIALILVPLYGLTRIDDLGPRIRFLWTQRWSLVLMGLVALACFAPQMIMWRYSAGTWLMNSYGNEGLPYLLRPQIINVLFSIKKGLLFYFPILLLGIAGLVPLRRRAPDFFWPTVIFLPLSLWLISSALIWWAGGGFGQRYFIESLAFVALPLSSLFVSCRVAWQRNLVAAAAILFVTHSLFLMYLYWTREFHIQGMDGAAYFDSLWWRKEAFLNLFR